MTAFRWLTARRVRRHPARAAMLVLIVGVALAPVIAVVVQYSSAQRAQRALGRELSGPAPLRVVGATIKGGLEPGVVRRIRALGSVKEAVPAVQAIALVDGSDAPIVVLGVDCSLTALFPAAPCDPSTWAAPTTPVVTSPRLLRGLAPGLGLRTTGARVDLHSAVAVPALDDVNGGRIVITDLARSQQLFSRGERLDVVYVLPRPGADLDAVRRDVVRAVPGRVRVLGRNDPPPGPDLAGQVSALLGVVALFGLVIGWLLVYSVARLTVMEREDDLAVERAYGRTRGRILRDLGMEGLVYGIAGGVVAAAVGSLLGSMLARTLGDLVGKYSGAVVTTTIPEWIPILAVGLAVAIVLSALTGPALRASRVDITTTSASQQATPAVDTAPSAIGMIMGGALAAIGLTVSEIFVGSSGLTPLGQVAGLGGLVLAVIGVFTVVPGSVPRLLAACARRATPDSRARMLLRNLVGHARQVGSVVLAVAFTVALTAMLGGLRPAMADASAGYTRAGLHGRYAVNTLPFNDSSLIDAKIGPALLARIRATVAPIEVSREVYLLTQAGDGVDIAVMASEHPRYPFRRLAGAAPDAAIAAGDSVIGAPLARRLDLRVGDHLPLDAPGTSFTMRIGSIAENINNAGMVASLPLDVVDARWGWQPPDPLLIGSASGGSQPTRTTMARVLALDRHLHAADSDELAAQTSTSIDQYLAPFDLLVKALYAVVAVSAFTSVALASIQRRREHATLAVIGISLAQRRALVLVEAAILGALGAVMGLVGGVILSEPLRNAASFVVGIRPPLQVPVTLGLGALLGGVVLVVVGAILPALRLRGGDLDDALRAA